MFGKLPFDDDLDFMDELNNEDKSIKFDGLYLVEEDGDEIYLVEEKSNISYLVVDEKDRLKVKNHIDGYVYVSGEHFPNETCKLFYVACKNILEKINNHPELNLDFDTISTIYYLSEKASVRLIDVMICCHEQKKYTGGFITHTYLQILVKWLLKKVTINRLLKLEDIFEDVYLPNGERMNQEVYDYLSEVENFDKKRTMECIHYLIFVSKKCVKFSKLFYEIYDYFINKYPTYKDEILQIMNYLFSMTQKNPMNMLFKGSNINIYLMILKEMSKYLDIPYVEMSLSSFGDAGDLSGFNATYTGAEKGRIAKKVLEFKTTSMILVFKGLDEINTSTANHSSVLGALNEILNTRKLNDNYLEYDIDLSSTFIVGTCFNYRNIHSSIASLFYSIKENTTLTSELIREELSSELNRLNLKDVPIDKKVIDRIAQISSMDPFNEVYKKYCKLIVHYYGNQIHGKKYLDENLVDEVLNTFEIYDDSMKCYFENYHDYDIEIKDRFKQYFYELKTCEKENQHKIQDKLDYLCCCRKTTTPSIDLDKVEKELNESHIGLENVKDILLNTLYQYPYDQIEANHLLFYSTHPGVGKTSIAMDACKACGIPIIHINCAQISMMASLYGDSIHPGLLLSKIKEIETIQAPIFLDEFEKCDVSIQNSLLNLTDTSNASFYSPYLECNIPMHCRFIIATANDLTKISDALKDRFRVIEFKPYKIQTKMKILKDKILHDLNEQYHHQIHLDDTYLYNYLSTHPFVSIRDMKSDFNVIYTSYLRNKTLMIHDYHPYQCCKNTINGLGVVGNSGCAFKIECLLYEENDQLKGNCKDVFKESYDIVLMALRHHKILNDEHVFMNIYGNSLEKDGPSAGLAMFACIYAKKNKIDLHDYAFTGELTIHGNVEAVGGIYYKLLACKQAGIHKVVIPFDNYKDYLEIASDLDNLEVYFVKNIHECIDLLKN